MALSRCKGRNEEKKREDKIRGRRGLFLFFFALVFRSPPPLFHFLYPSRYFRSFIACHLHAMALSMFSISLSRDEAIETRNAWRVFRCDSIRACVHACASRQLETVERKRERAYAKRSKLKTGQRKDKLGRDREELGKDRRMKHYVFRILQKKLIIYFLIILKKTC